MKLTPLALLSFCLISIGTYGQGHMSTTTEPAKAKAVEGEAFQQETRYERMLKNSDEANLLQGVDTKNLSPNNVELKKIAALEKKIQGLNKSATSPDQQIKSDCEALRLKKVRGLLVTMNRSDFDKMSSADQAHFRKLVGEYSPKRAAEFK